MKFAHFSHVWNKESVMTAAQRYDQLWRELAICDEFGFEFGFAVEHHFSPHESWMPSPPVYCTGGAAHTKRIRLGPMGYIPALYDPLRIVEETAVLDHVLNGRLEIGLVSGIIPDYFLPYKADFQSRRELTYEALLLLKAAFSTEGPFSFNGQFHQYKDVTLSIKALQKPHPPLWVQSRDPDTLELLARDGIHTGYLMFMPRDVAAPRYHQYLQLWQQAGHQQKPNIGYWTLVYVDETDERAIRNATPHILHTFGQVFGFGDAGGKTVKQIIETYEKRGEVGAAEIARNMDNVDYLLEHNLVFVGSPENVAQRVRKAATEGLFNTVFCEFNIGLIEEEDLMRSIRLFGTQVIPSLRTFEPY